MPMTTSRLCVLGVLTMVLSASLALGAPLRTGDGLAGQATATQLQQVSLDGKTIGGLSVEAVLLDPSAGQPAGAGFTVAGTWRAEGNRLTLQGEVKAAGTEDRAADLVVRVTGAQLPLSTMAEDPLLQPRKLLSKLPLVSLRCGEQDSLALAVPPDKLASFDFRQAEGAVELRYRFGFTNNARPELKMRAPFTCTLYRTDPRWHFRSALQRYYALFPELFRPFEKRQGGWFFAAETPDLPNPQHFFFHEGGPGGWEADDERGMGTFPYRESSSYTVALPGSVPPKTYAEAMEQFAELEKQITPASWSPQQTFTVDEQVRHAGARSLLADPGTTKGWVGASQTISVKPPLDKPIVVSAFSRAEGVAGEPGADYSIYVDVVYADGSYLFGQTAQFNTGTHDWEQAKRLIEPTKPVAEMRVYCLLRGHTGRVWFDDLHVGPADAPETNWVQNPGFEIDAKRRDLQYIRDNVAHDSNGNWVFAITDNLSADVGPSTPMNLLRFTLNPDPDIPSTEERPAVGAGEIKYFDEVFRDLPSIDGAYIDSVSAWIYGVLNGRRDQWASNDHAFTYDPGNMKVVAAGRWAMVKYLHRLQERYHPLGKSIFTNIHVNLEAFPLYLVSDVPGIESSLFQDEDSMFFYRASSNQKPLVLLNFMNLHGLDRRETAVEYHVNAAQWGEFPSTGRFVQRAYQEYGDVTHQYLPAIKELSAAGWQPVPLAEGARVERFGAGDVAYFTVRAPQAAAEQVLGIQPAALPKGEDLVAYEATKLARLPLRQTAQGWQLPLTHGNGDLTIVRICRQGQVLPWLLERARQHALQAGRVRGKESLTPQITALQQALAGNVTQAQVLAKLPDWRGKLQAALASVQGAPEDLFALSSRREIEQAREALAAVAMLVAGVEPGLSGERIGYPGEVLSVGTVLPKAGTASLRLLDLKAEPVDGRMPAGAARTETGMRLTPAAPGAIAIRGQFALTPAPGQPEWQVERSATVHILPSATMTVQEEGSTAQERVYRVEVARQEGLGKLEVQAAISPEAVVETPAVELAPGQASATVRTRREEDGLPRTLLLRTVAGGNELARAEVSYWDEPALPQSDLALAKGGAKAITDSNYPGGYSPAAMTNGRLDAQGLHWTEAAWASIDNNEPHWVQIDLAKPATVGGVWIYWAQDNGRTHTSRQYQIIGLTPAGEERVLLKVDETQTRSFSRHVLPPTEVRAIRIAQAAGGGPEGRPGIMWIREVAVLAAK